MRTEVINRHLLEFGVDNRLLQNWQLERLRHLVLLIGLTLSVGENEIHE